MDAVKNERDELRDELVQLKDILKVLCHLMGVGALNMQQWPLKQGLSIAAIIYCCETQKHIISLCSCPTQKHGIVLGTDLTTNGEKVEVVTERPVSQLAQVSQISPKEGGNIMLGKHHYWTNIAICYHLLLTS